MMHLPLLTFTIMKIYDQINLRAYSLKMAIESDMLGMSENNLIQRAKAFEMYIQGDVELPDFMPVPDSNTNVHICNGYTEDYDDEEEDNGIGLN